MDKKALLHDVYETFQRFFKVQALGGIILIIATIAALILANSGVSEYYHDILHEKITIGWEGHTFTRSLEFWINDILMAIFFFVVGLEIKRELLVGELSSFRHAVLPLTAAIGGMIFPALIYVSLNQDAGAAQGWGIPMATDIAFAVGILSLFGKRIPVGLKVFLTAFAIVDDIGAVIIIAVFYSQHILWIYLLIALGLLVVLVVANMLDITAIAFYVVLGIFVWVMVSAAGIHPTTAGVMVAFTIPARRKVKVPGFIHRIKTDIEIFANHNEYNKVSLSKPQIAAIDNIDNYIVRVQSPLQFLNHHLHGFVTYFVMPLFALANAGMVFSGFASSVNMVSLNIAIGLIVGKVTGIFTFSWLTVKTGLADLPHNTNWQQILAAGFLGGIGFTMSLFINNLAFEDAAMINSAKIGIIGGSMIAGGIGYYLLRKFQT